MKKKANDLSKKLMEEAQGQVQVQAQQREDLGLPLEPLSRRIKKIGIQLLMAEKPSFTCLKCHSSSVEVVIFLVKE